MTLHSAIPATDAAEFYALPKAVQQDVIDRLRIIDEISGATGRGAVDKLCRQHHSSTRRGFSKQSHWRYWNHWQATPDWHILIDRVKCPAAVIAELADAAIRRQFIELVQGFCDGNQRKDAPGIRKFYRYWREGGKVPGYGTWRDYWAARGHGYVQTCPNQLPAGWTLANLTKLCARPKIEKTLARIGTAAAMNELPPIPGTRTGLRPLEFVTWDDLQRDKKVCVPGYPMPVRIVQLANRDTATARWLRFGIRPMLPSEADATRSEALRLADMKALMAVHLLDFGWPRDYVSYQILENGTATLPTADAQALYQISEGHLVCCYSTMQGGMVLAWDERGKGNPRAKAGHESDHNLWHNEDADAPGQIGKDRDHSPASGEITARHARDLTLAGALMSPAERARLKLPYADFYEAVDGTLAVMDRINNRLGHNLEGFQRVIEWRLKGAVDWKTEEELHVWLRETGHTLEDVCPKFVELHPTPRLETPMERWRRLTADIVFIKPAPCVIQQFLDEHREVRVDKGSIRLRFEGRDHIYWPPTNDDALPDFGDCKRTYLAWFSRFAMDWIILTDDKLGYVGTWQRTQIMRHDPVALSAAIKRKSGLLNKALANVRRRGVKAMEDREADLDTNLRVLGDNGLLTTETIHQLSAASLTGSGDESARPSTRAITPPGVELPRASFASAEEASRHSPTGDGGSLTDAPSSPGAAASRQPVPPVNCCPVLRTDDSLLGESPRLSDGRPLQADRQSPFASAEEASRRSRTGEGGTIATQLVTATNRARRQHVTDLTEADARRARERARIRRLATVLEDY
jgi:hypothetical protein